MVLDTTVGKRQEKREVLPLKRPPSWRVVLFNGTEVKAAGKVHSDGTSEGDLKCRR